MDENTLNQPIKNKGGRPKGSKDAKPRKRRTPQEITENIPAGSLERTTKSGNASKVPVSALVTNAIDGWNSEKFDLSDTEEIKRRVGDYFKTCSERGIKPTRAGLCNRLVIHSTTLYKWYRGERRGGEHQEIAQKVVGVLEELMEGYGNEGLVHPLIVMFNMKNQFGYKDQQDIVVSPKQTTSYPMDMDKITELAEQDDVIELGTEQYSVKTEKRGSKSKKLILPPDNDDANL